VREKEITVIGMTEALAIERLKNEFEQFIKDKDIKLMRWLINPRAEKIIASAKLAGQWRAYGRIAYEANKNAG